MQNISKKTNSSALILNRKRKGFTLKSKKNKGFTLIELIVVIAIIGILVLLAMPKFMDYTRDAKDAKTQHDARVAEDAVTEHLIGNDDKLPEDLSGVTPEEIQDAIDEGRAYDTEGPVAEVPGGPYVDVTDLEEVKDGGIKTDGTVISNKDGDVFIILDKAIRTDVCVLRADQIIRADNVNLTGVYTNTTVRDKYPDAEFYEYGGYIFISDTVDAGGYGSMAEYDLLLVDYIGGSDNLIVPGKVEVMGTGINPQSVGYVTAIDDAAFTDQSITIAELPCTITGTMSSGDAGDMIDVCSLREDQQLVGAITNIEQDANSAQRFVDNEVLRVGDYKFGILLDNPSNVELTYYLGSETDIVIPGKIIVGDNEYNVTSIMGPEEEYGTFEGYNNAATIEIPCTITKIGDYVFDGNNLASVSIPDSVEEIGMYAFSDNPLTEIFIGSGVETVGKRAFNSEILTTLVVDTDNPYYKSVNNAIYSKDGTSLILGSLNMGTQIEPTTKIIKEWAFYKLDGLTSVVIPDSVVTIEDNAFWGLDVWSSLTHVEIGSGVTHIGNKAFYRNEIDTLILGNNIESIGSNAFSFNKLTSATIPDNVTTIDGSAFADNDLTSVTIGSSVTEIGESAFANNNLTSITIPASVGTIRFTAFVRNRLEQVSFQGIVTTKEEWAFRYNGPLKDSNSIDTGATWSGTFNLINSDWVK